MVLYFTGTGNSRYLARRVAEGLEMLLYDLNACIKAGDTAPVNPVFYRFFVKADAFRATDACTGCGRCVELCPLNNVHLKNGKPVWGKNCTHCMACICYCLNRRRIEESKYMLGNTGYSLAQISELMGFSSPSYFSQCFRKAEGLTPNEYRRQVRQGQRPALSKRHEV